MRSILESIAAGDESAVSACLDEYGDLVWRLASRYLGRVSGDVEDAVQEVFVELWTSAGRYDPKKGSEAAFVATLAHRRLTDYQRRAGARLSRVSPDGGAIERSSRSVTVDQSRGELASRVAERFNELPEDERSALRLAMHEGLTHKQISETFGIPIGTVKTRLRRAVMRLHDAITPSGAGKGDAR